VRNNEVVTASRTRATLQALDLPGGSPPLAVPGQVREIAASPDGRFIAATFRGPDAPGRLVVWAHDGKTMRDIFTAAKACAIADRVYPLDLCKGLQGE